MCCLQFPVLFGGLAAPEADKLEKVHEALGWLDGYLDGQDYAAGDTVTIADHSLVASVATFAATGQFIEPTNSVKLSAVTSIFTHLELVF